MKFCKDCKHCEQDVDTLEHRCIRPHGTPNVNLVTGASCTDRLQDVTCEDERSFSIWFNTCGKRAKYYEAALPRNEGTEL